MRITFFQFTKSFTYPPGNIIKYIKVPFPWASIFFSGLSICVSIRMRNLFNDKENGVPKPWLRVTPAIRLECSIRPYRNTYMTANVSVRQQNASLQQLIYNIAWVQRQHIGKQVCSSVYQLYRRIGNKRSVKENENQCKENCFASRKTLQCGQRKHGMAYIGGTMAYTGGSMGECFFVLSHRDNLILWVGILRYITWFNLSSYNEECHVHSNTGWANCSVWG